MMSLMNICKQYNGQEITEKTIVDILKKIPSGINIYLFLHQDPDEGYNWLEINCDSKWIALRFLGDLGLNNYFSYNLAFADITDQISKANSDKNVYTNLKSGGQSSIPKNQAITDIEAGVEVVEYFIQTGEFYPGIYWLHEKH